MILKPYVADTVACKLSKSYFIIKSMSFTITYQLEQRFRCRISMDWEIVERYRDLTYVCYLIQSHVLLFWHCLLTFDVKGYIYIFYFSRIYVSATYTSDPPSPVYQLTIKLFIFSAFSFYFKNLQKQHNMRILTPYIFFFFLKLWKVYALLCM